ncbi:MAG: HD domain-containing protein [Candidatus Shikimatogenerans bostrichidophilus]|nr:MAG: HD domain-containing protein [Candidatus Shikimatogenerans bostrichidophilus]
MFKKKILNLIKKNKIFTIISKLSDKLNYKTYIIGGFTRNIFINKKNKIFDIDIVTTGDSYILAKNFTNILSIKKIFVFKRFKTVIVNYNNINIEFVSTRKEYYNLYNNKPYVKKLNNINEDQKRRDFTINTIAINLNKKNFCKIIDPFNGIRDINKKIIKTPINPDKIYYDDPLRMIRAIRFATQLNFKISKKSLKSIKKNKYRLRIISIERINIEFNKIILSNKPSKGIKLMYKLGFLNMYLPELLDLNKVKIINGFTYKNNFKHTLKVIDKISKYSNNLWLKWATLLHDIGKPVSKKFDNKKGWTFYNHEIIGSNMINYIFYKLKLPIKKNIEYIKTIIKYSNISNILINKEVKVSTIRKFIYKIGYNNIKDLLLLSKCDITTSNYKLKKEKEKNIKKLYNNIKTINSKDNINNIKLYINGNFIMKYFNIPQSKIIGIIKSKIKKHIIEGKINNTFKDSINLMKILGKKIIKKYDKKKNKK